MLIHGDNLLALRALEDNFTGAVKCIYIDPPYNTGNAFELYDDNSSEFYYVNPTSFEKLMHFNEPKMTAEQKIDKPKESMPERLQNRQFEAVKATESETMKIDMAEPEQKPANEAEENNTPSEKEESFQVETFKITM